jgi:hypothetical protein
MKRDFFLVILLFIPAHLWAIPEVQIRTDDVPFLIGQSARYTQNTDLFEWAPFDSMRTWWDLTVYPGGSFARVHLINVSQGIPPAPDTFPNAQILELDTLGNGQVVWTYLSETQFFLYSEGIDYESGGFRFLLNFRPDGKVYAYPMYDGSSWNTAYVYTYEVYPGLPYSATEQHQKTIVAKGKVKVPFSGVHFWPCLVIRDHMEYSDNFGNWDTRWIYEWVVPGRFGGGNGVAAAQSTNGGSQNFMIVENFLMQSELYVPGWDVHGPEFASTTVWPDTGYLGPFVVQSTITDSSGIGADSLFYNINGGPFAGVGHDSVISDVYYYTIPPAASECTLGYFIWAEDSFCVANGVDLWHTDPICAPESTYFGFSVWTGITEGAAQSACGTLRLEIFPNPFMDCITIKFQVPSTNPPHHMADQTISNTQTSLRIYDAAGKMVRSFPCSMPSALCPMQATWDGSDASGRQLPSGVYFVKLVNGKDAVTRTVVLTR